MRTVPLEPDTPEKIRAARLMCSKLTQREFDQWFVGVCDDIWVSAIEGNTYDLIREDLADFVSAYICWRPKEDKIPAFGTEALDIPRKSFSSLYCDHCGKRTLGHSSDPELCNCARSSGKVILCDCCPNQT